MWTGLYRISTLLKNRFFEIVFSEIRPGNLSAVMIAGDLLTSDIQGGKNAGIKTCWYNPGRKELPGHYRADYVIADLHELLSLPVF